jgi:hypothetical protein
MQSMSFDPVVADIGSQVVNLGIDCLEAGATALPAVTGLVPAGGDEVSARAAMAFGSEAIEVLTLNKAAQEELMRSGAAFIQIARAYTEADLAAAHTLTFGTHGP